MELHAFDQRASDGGRPSSRCFVGPGGDLERRRQSSRRSIDERMVARGLEGIGTSSREHAAAVVMDGRRLAVHDASRRGRRRPPKRGPDRLMSEADDPRSGCGRRKRLDGLDLETPASRGVQGPGEMTIRSGASVDDLDRA